MSWWQLSNFPPSDSKATKKVEEIAGRRRLRQQDLVVFAEQHAKYDAGDNLETVDPQFPLQALSAEVKHMYPVEHNLNLMG